jgi:hypothetical protein
LGNPILLGPLIEIDFFNLKGDHNLNFNVKCQSPNRGSNLKIYLNVA